MTDSNCEFCGCDQVHNFHHFIPKTVHRNKWFKKRYSKQELSQGMNVCKECHDTIHDLIPDEKEIGKKYNSRRKLLSHPQIAGYIKWKKKRRR